MEQAVADRLLAAARVASEQKAVAAALAQARLEVAEKESVAKRDDIPQPPQTISGGRTPPLRPPAN